MSQICVEEGVCLNRPNAWWGGKFEWPKTLQRITAGELQRLVESWVSESLKKLSNSTYIPTNCSGGFQEKSSALIQKQSPAYSVVRQDWNFKRDRLLWSDETKKNSFLAANPPDGFGAHMDKKYPMPTVKYTAGSLMLWAYFFCWRSWTSCSDTWYHGFYQIPTDKKKTWPLLLEIL